ncbi:MAG: universal stress protein [Proteobacteria bacterium]|nr:universal stress protein [Pseudomonadota bacterium]MBU1570418.1 universal stress protein [Pseudomonadota bacterium]
MIKKILVPTDGSKGSENAIQMAAELAKNHNAELYILYVVPKGEIPKKVVDYLREERIDGGLGKLSTKVIGETVLEPVLKKVNSQGVKAVKWMVLRGDPAQEILKFAKSRKVDMIVMGKSGQRGIKGLLLGSVSHKVCNLAECACVTVK